MLATSTRLRNADHESRWIEIRIIEKKGIEAAGQQSARVRDQALVAAALGGDTASLRALLVRLTPIIKLRVRRSLSGVSGGGTSEIDDCTQDVLLRLFAQHAHALRSWCPDAGLSLDNYVRMIARREVATLLRSRRRTPFEQTLQDPAVMDAERATGEILELTLEARQDCERLRQQLSAQASPRAVAIFIELFVRQLPPQEVAEQLELSVASVYQWRRRLKAVLQTLESASAAAQ
jgi:RNA polymerase sigma factor (sigma-70 family)